MTAKEEPDPSILSNQENSDTIPNPDQAWKALGLVNDWIRHAEAKTTAILAAAGVSGGVLYNLVKSQDHPNAVVSLVAVVCGLAIFVSGGSAIIALMPQLKPRQRRAPRAGRDSGDPPLGEDPANLLFFGHIARDYKGDAPTYAQVLRTLTSDPESLVEHIGRQVHANSHIANRKYRWATGAIIALGVDLAFLALTAILVGRT
jgi:hypothetical protein